MSKLRVRCPQGHLLEVELAHAGKQVQCPLCNVIMRIPDLPSAKAGTTTGSPAPLHRDLQKDQVEYQGDFEEEDKPQKKFRPNKAGLKPVRLGLNYHIAQLYVLVLGAIFLGILGGVVAANSPDGGMRRAAGEQPGINIVMIFGVLIRLAYVVLGVISCVYLLQVPERTRTKSLVVAYVALELVLFSA
jgi:hypothetical protein